MRFKNKEAEAASDLTNPRITNSGENIRPPPRPTIVSTREMKKMAIIKITDTVIASSDAGFWITYFREWNFLLYRDDLLYRRGTHESVQECNFPVCLLIYPAADNNFHTY